MVFFFGGMISAVILVALAPQLAFLGLEFGPWDYFSLIIFALTITVSLSGGNITKGLIAGLLGLFAATVGKMRLMALQDLPLVLMNSNKGSHFYQF